MTGLETARLENAGGTSVPGVENAERSSMERQKYKSKHNRTVNK